MADVNDKASELKEKQVTDERQIWVRVCAYQDGEEIVDTWTGAMGHDGPRRARAPDPFFNHHSLTFHRFLDSR